MARIPTPKISFGKSNGGSAFGKLRNGLSEMKKRTMHNYENMRGRQNQNYAQSDLSGEVNFASFLSEQLNAIKETIYKHAQDKQIDSIMGDLKKIQDDSTENYKDFLDRSVKNGTLSAEVAEKEKNSLWNTAKTAVVGAIVGTVVAKGVNIVMDNMQDGTLNMDSIKKSLDNINLNPKDLLDNDLIKNAQEHISKASESVTEVMEQVHTMQG